MAHDDQRPRGPAVDESRQPLGHRRERIGDIGLRARAEAGEIDGDDAMALGQRVEDRPPRRERFPVAVEEEEGRVAGARPDHAHRHTTRVEPFGPVRRRRPHPIEQKREPGDQREHEPPPGPPAPHTPNPSRPPPGLVSPARSLRAPFAPRPHHPPTPERTATYSRPSGPLKAMGFPTIPEGVLNFDSSRPERWSTALSHPSSVP